MNIYDQAAIIYKNVLGSQFINGGPIMGADFSLAEFEVAVIGTLTLSGITGTFVVGETITDGTSGATATVVSVSAHSLTINTIAVGAFGATHTITGGTSGATATIASLDLPTYAFSVQASNQVMPPNLSLPSSPTNKYEGVGYTDTSSGAFYNVGNEYSPGGNTQTKKFSIAFKARWYFITLLNVVGGTSTPIVDVTLSNN